MMVVLAVLLQLDLKVEVAVAVVLQEILVQFLVRVGMDWQHFLEILVFRPLMALLIPHLLVDGLLEVVDLALIWDQQPNLEEQEVEELVVLQRFLLEGLQTLVVEVVVVLIQQQIHLHNQVDQEL
jgi:hypothetical protein